MKQTVAHLNTLRLVLPRDIIGSGILYQPGAASWLSTIQPFPLFPHFHSILFILSRRQFSYKTLKQKNKDYDINPL